MGVLLHQCHHVVGGALHYLVVALTALRKGPLRVRHQQLVIETGRCQVEQQFDETDVLLLDRHQRPEDGEEALTQDDRRTEIGLV